MDKHTKEGILSGILFGIFITALISIAIVSLNTASNINCVSEQCRGLLLCLIGCAVLLIFYISYNYDLQKGKAK